MNYDQIKYFLRAAECLNFSEAARQMFITPQAFGRQISALEDTLGIKLFKRTKHSIQLTFEGEILYKHMSPLVEALEQEYMAMEQMAKKRRGKLNVGILCFLSRENCVSPLINSIYSSSGTVDINTQMYEMKDMMDAMASGEIDLGITLLNEGMCHFGDYEVVSLKSAVAGLVVSIYHKWVTKDAVTKEDMAKVKRVRFDVSRGEDNEYIKYPCKEDVIVDNYATLLNFIERGEGYAIVSPDMGDAGMQYNTKFFPLPGEPLDFDLVLMYKKSEDRPEVLEIIERIIDVFEP